MESPLATIACATLLLGLIGLSWARTRLAKGEGDQLQGDTVRDLLAAVEDELGVDAGVGRKALRTLDLLPASMVRGMADSRGRQGASAAEGYGGGVDDAVAPSQTNDERG